ncbi:zinc-finger homeodomain protein 2-like [Malania oleifera]|uniref:zinc-finger homeodomain protein 2-like n=1 Tax=Malania oleifera TaxID=397392 RepID=UPI0025AEC7FB|nr:zinc-finger homeodomain protein 2-like [Malania oleifera]
MAFGGQQREMKTAPSDHHSLGYISPIHESSSLLLRTDQRRNSSNYTNIHAIFGGSTESTPDDHPQSYQHPSSSLGEARDPDVDTKKPPLKATATARYLECLKNHAASTGGNVVDGCCEFMRSGEEGTPEAFRCAACNCHRNFHRRVVEGDAQFLRGATSAMVHPLQLPSPLSAAVLLQQQKISMGSLHASPLAAAVQPMTVAFGGSVGAESSSEDLNVGAPPPPPPGAVLGGSKKRFRTKFTQEQKERMLEFAEKMGWRIQNQSEEEIQRFCAEVGVKRQVLKVWMHNNKNSVKQQQQQQQHPQPQPQPQQEQL